MKALVFSDFHMLARRSQGEKHIASIIEKAPKFEKLIICGDLFDFRWSEAASLEDAFQKAETILKSLIEASNTTEVHYILGNHDSNAEFLPHLISLSEQHANFSWYPDYLQVGNTLFLHGDIPMKNEGASISPRPHFKQEEKIWGKTMNILYDIITATRLVNLYRKVVDANRKLPFIMQAVQNSPDFGGVSEIVFGHSHHHFTDKKIGKYTIHNLGSGVKGYKANILELDIEL